MYDIKITGRKGYGRSTMHLTCSIKDLHPWIDKKISVEYACSTSEFEISLTNAGKIKIRPDHASSLSKGICYRILDEYLYRLSDAAAERDEENPIPGHFLWEHNKPQTPAALEFSAPSSFGMATIPIMSDWENYNAEEDLVAVAGVVVDEL